MKKLILLLLVIVSTVTISAQTPFKGFWRPLDRAAFQTIGTIDQDARTDRNANLWLFRPVVTISAMQFMLTNPVEVSSFSSLGTGISYQNIISQNEKPYTRFGINALILFTQKIGDVEPASLSFALTGSFWQYISIGGGYSLQAKKFFLLTGIAYNFN